ncbi:MAG: ATP-dependent DNA helicase [bacterium]
MKRAKKIVKPVKAKKLRKKPVASAAGLFDGLPLENIKKVETAKLPRKDASQEEAIKHVNGPLLVVAGAGTGKTRVITERIAHLINSKLAKPEQILALTFSEKAAAEMEKRVDMLVPYGFVDTQISTFHSFGHSVIEENFAALKISPDWKILKTPDAVIFIIQNFDRFKLDLYRPLSNPAQYVSKFIGLISKLKDNLITPEMYALHTAELKTKISSEEEQEVWEAHEELSLFYKTYEDLKTEKNFMDFGDLIYVPYYFFKTHKAALKKYTDRYSQILIDEFQDTNYAQFELVKLLADKTCNICVVGDDDQMIYRFRGAAVSNIKGFLDHYKDTKIVVLKNNYRSVQHILDSAHKLVSNNGDRLETLLKIDKHLASKYTPSIKHKENLHIKFFDNYSEEADFVADEITRLTQDFGYSFKDIGILMRANSDANIFLKTFERRGIPFRFSGDRGLYNKKEVMFLINFCRVLVTPFEFNPVCDVAVSEYYGVDPFIISKFLNLSKDYGTPVIDLMKKPEKYSGLELSTEEALKIKNFVTDAEHYIAKAKEGWGAGEILYDFLKEKRVFETLLKQADVEAEAKISNISRFFDTVKQFSINEEYDTIYNFVNYIDLRIKAGDNPQDESYDYAAQEAVQVMSVHKAKGLEFKVVFVPALVQDKFPSRSKAFAFPLPEGIMKDLVDEKAYMQEEERRLFYVAMTRAQELLYLTAAFKYEGKSTRKISIFLRELGVQKEEDYLMKLDKNARMKYFERGTHPLAVYTAKKIPENIRLSNYQIDDYLTCPYKYKLIHILKMPIKANPNIVYGQAMHKVASEYYRAKQEDTVKTLEDLKQIFIAMWKPSGFISPDHEKKMFEKALGLIDRFYTEEETKTIVPKFIEKGFEFKFDKDIVIAGRWDRIDEVDGKAVIIDYKTSKVDTVEEAKKKISSDEISKQLKLYALAYERVFGKPADKVGVYFFESCLLVVKEFKHGVVEEFGEKIHEVAAGVKTRAFHATPSQFECSHCAFNTVCEFSKSDVGF